MNGRVYDPEIGRFMSVDPVFQFPENLQSLNPYSYVLNNPLSLTDPSGWTACSSVSTNATGSGTCTLKIGNSTYNVSYRVFSDGTVKFYDNTTKFDMPPNGKLDSSGPRPRPRESANSGDAQGSAAGRGNSGNVASGESIAQTTTTPNAATPPIGGPTTPTQTTPGDVVLPEAEGNAQVAMLESAKVTASNEAGKVTSIDQGSRRVTALPCVNTKCDVVKDGKNLFPGNAIVVAHSHVIRTEETGSPDPGRLGDLKATFRDSLPGPKDHKVVTDLRVPSVVKGTTGAITVIERIDGRIRLRQLAGPSLSTVDKWRPGKQNPLTREQSRALRLYKAGKLSFQDALKMGGVQ